MLFKLLSFPSFYILYLFVSQVNISAQNQKIVFEHFSIEQGLPSAVVPALFQDRTGYLWFGTFYGVARYDGYSIKSYINREGDSASVANSIVNAVCDDSEGNIWFGHSRGLDKFDPSTEKFTHYVLNNEKPLTDWSQYVLSLHEDKSGTLWVGTGAGLYVFNKSKVSFTLIKHDSTDSHSISSSVVNSIYEDRSGTLWYATGNGLNRFDKSTKQFIHYLSGETKNSSNSGYPYWLLSIFEDSDGILWLGTSDGMIEFNRQSGAFTLFQNDPADPQSLANNTVLSICEDRLGQLWISTKGGVDLFNKRTGTFSHYKHIEDDPGSLTSNDVGQILRDRSGAMWISTYGGGVNKFTPPDPFFKYYSIEGGKNAMAPSTDLTEDINGNLWMATARGLLKFDPGKETFERLAVDKDIYLVLSDRTGIIWFSAWNEGLGKIDQSGHISRFTDLSGSEFPGWVTAMCNGHNGNIWVGTNEGNVYSYIPDAKKIIPVFQGTNWIEVIYEDKAGFVWIGAREAGIICYDPSQKIFSHYSHTPGDAYSLSSNSITRIREDCNNDLLIVTGHTLNKFDRASGRFIRLGGKNGYPENIYYVTEDAKGNLWIGVVGKGVVKYDPQNKQFRDYLNLYGMGYRSKSGELYYFNKKSLIRFFPDSLKDNPFIPPIVITSMRSLERPCPIRKEVHLSYTENFISFEFASLNFINPERNQYAYKMEGVDKDWVYCGTRRFASYPNLDPGKYVFRVKGSNNDGVWNEEGTTIAVIISPPFWKSWWAYLSYITLLIFTLYGIRRYELNRISYKNQVEIDKAVLIEKEETENIKSRFFANISHEFRTPLTLILGPAEKILSSTSEDIPRDAGIIRQNARRLLQLVNQLLDLSRLEAGKLKLEASRSNIVSFVKGAALSFESLAESKDINLILIPEKDFIELYFDKEKMLKILTNLLSNAFKFTPDEGIISVSINEIKSSGIVQIKIKDTGIGIPQAEIPKLFDRFYQVDNSFTKEHEGTGIGLALTKELVELHRGTITLESRTASYDGSIAGWTEFEITLPMGRSHLNDDEIVETEKTGSAFLAGVSENFIIPAPHPDENILTVPSGDKTVILLVEDNYDMRQYIKESLGNRFLVEEAVNGEQGIRKAEKIIPDLIITDMMMPRMDGSELTRILKSREKTSHIPIILLTARSGQENKIEGLVTGADDYLTKPFDLRELQVRIDNLIRIRKKLQAKFSDPEFILKNRDIKGTNPDEQFIIKIMDVIEKHIGEENFSIEDFGKEAGMSRTQFHRKFKAVTGKTASMFLRSVRLARAKKMIEVQQGNISEISYLVGFSSPSYFTKCFREEFGNLPSDLLH